MTKRRRSNAGFTLLELMIVAGIIAVIAAVGIPKLVSARLASNENTAIATLRAIAAAQQELQASCAIDTDADGGGEFGYFGELAGAVPMRVYDPVTNMAVLGVAPDAYLEPPYLATAFGDLTTDASGAGVVERQGYLFKLFLPGPTVAGVTQGLAEDPVGGASVANLGPAWGSANCEIMWCAYAWPVTAEKTGNRAFFVNQEGEILQYDNRDGEYRSTTNPPTFDAAYSSVVANDMGQDLGLMVMGLPSNDGNVWTVVAN